MCQGRGEGDSYAWLVKSKRQAFVKMRVDAKQCGPHVLRTTKALDYPEQGGDMIIFCKDAVALEWGEGVRAHLGSLCHCFGKWIEVSPLRATEPKKGGQSPQEFRGKIPQAW